jgi:hypothetical protein
VGWRPIADLGSPPSTEGGHPRSWIFWDWGGKRRNENGYGTKIDRESLAAVIRELVDDDTLCSDLCLVYDSEAGEFAIESKRSPRSESEHVIADRVGDTPMAEDASTARTAIADAVEALRERMAFAAVTDMLAGMDNDYIAEHVIGNLDAVDDL